MQEKTDTQTRMNPGASFIVDGGGPVLSARVGGDCDRILVRELTGEEERKFADIVDKAMVRELESWDQFKVSPPEKSGAQSRDLVDTR